MIKFTLALTLLTIITLGIFLAVGMAIAIAKAYGLENIFFLAYFSPLALFYWFMYREEESPPNT